MKSVLIVLVVALTLIAITGCGSTNDRLISMAEQSARRLDSFRSAVDVWFFLPLVLTVLGILGLAFLVFRFCSSEPIQPEELFDEHRKALKGAWSRLTGRDDQ